jgi:hypothetical protein
MQGKLHHHKKLRSYVFTSILCKYLTILLRAASSSVINITAASVSCKPHKQRADSSAKALVAQKESLREGGARV